MSPRIVSEMSPLLELKAVSKRFPGVLALDQAEFELKPGEVHVLFGENGAGKSTLISLIAGVYQPTSGEIKFRGNSIELNSVCHARALGISAVFQEFSLVGQLTVEQNLFLGDEQTKGLFLDQKALHEEAKRILEQLDFPLKSNRKVSCLSRAEQQMVEIAKAFRSELSVLILDEPTASLTEKETERLFSLIEKVKAKNVGVIYITHRMAEIRHVGDRITILRDGRCINTVDAKTASDEELVRLMTGRVIDQIFPRIDFKPGAVALEVTNLSTVDKRVDGLSIKVRRGEIVGIAGLVGSGKSTALRACFGLGKISSGKVMFEGEDVTGSSVNTMLNKGFFYNSRNRHAEGLVMMRNCRENMTLSSLRMPDFQFKNGLLNQRDEQRIAIDLAKKLKLYPMKIDRPVEHFSGGNQQKVLLSKCLTREVKIYVFDEPTVGVDVGTRAEIYKLIAGLCDQGAAIVIVSSDLPEVLHLSHRVYVMCRGKLQVELTGNEITEESVLKYFFGREAA